MKNKYYIPKIEEFHYGKNKIKQAIKYLIKERKRLHEKERKDRKGYHGHCNINMLY